MSFIKITKAVISVALITAILLPDAVRAMQEENEGQLLKARSLSVPDLSKLKPIKKNVPTEIIVKKNKLKVRHPSLDLSEKIIEILPQKKIVDFQSYNKRSESKRNSSDSNTTSPRKQDTVEDTNRLSTSSSPEKSSASSSENLTTFTEQNTKLLTNNTENLPKTPLITLELGEKKQHKSPFETVKPQNQSSMFITENTVYIFETQEKGKDKYTEKTPLLIDKKAPKIQQKPTFPSKEVNTNQKTAELKVLNSGSINTSENEYSNFEEEDTQTIFEEDHKDKKKKWNSDSVDDFDFTLITDIDKRGCCCNRPCLPHPELWRKVSDLRNVIEISDEELKGSKEVKNPKTINLPNVTDHRKEKESSQPLIIPSIMIIESDEKDLKSSPYVETLKKLNFKELSKHTKTQLNFINREIEGPWPKWEWIKKKQWGKLGEWAKNELPGAAIGTAVGGWLAPAMVPVYESAGIYLEFTYLKFNEKPWFGIMNFVADTAKPYIIPVIILDAVPRNVVSWRKGLTLLKEEDVSKKRVALTALASFFPSLFEPSYLVLMELELIGIAHSQHFDDSLYKNQIFKYTWPLLIDSWTNNFQTTWNQWDAFQEWRQTTNIRCLRSTYIPSPEERMCWDYKKKLNKVSKWLYRTASSEQIKAVYDKLKRSEADVEELFPNLQKEDLPNARAFLGLNELLSLGDELERTQRYIKSWYDIGADIINGTVLVTGTPARLLTLQLMISSITGLIPLPWWLQWFRHTVNWGGATLGSIPQAGTEWQGVNTFFKDFLAQEEPDGEAAFKNAKAIGGFRVSGKVYALLQAAVFTLPLVVTVLQVANKWKMDPLSMIGASTFVLAEYLTQVSKQWSWSFQKWVSLGSTLYNNVRNTCGGSLSTQHQRAYILGFIENAKDRIPYFTSELLHILKGNLDYKNESEKEEQN